MSPTIKKILDVAIPRFVTEEAALRHGKDGKADVLVVKCKVFPGEHYDAEVTVRSFNLFGAGLFPRIIGEQRPWVDPYGEDRG